MFSILPKKKSFPSVTIEKSKNKSAKRKIPTETYYLKKQAWITYGNKKTHFYRSAANFFIPGAIFRLPKKQNIFSTVGKTANKKLQFSQKRRHTRMY